MKISLDCYPCLLHQVLSTTFLAGLTDAEQKTVMDFVLHTMADISTPIYPQEIVVSMYDFIHDNYRKDDAIFDPYADVKRHTREIATQFYEQVRNRISTADNSLEMALKCAALGNIIDFGAKAHGNVDVHSELHKLDDLTFAIYHFGEFHQRLQSSRLVLYIGDNVGEDVFDKAFISEIKAEFPAIHVVFAAREIPVINDATVADAITIGMDQVADVISSGSVLPGTILDRTTPVFQKHFQQADLIISKGQGNYETLCEHSHPSLFFLLRAKCDKMARLLDVPINSMILKQSS